MVSIICPTFVLSMYDRRLKLGRYTPLCPKLFLSTHIKKTPNVKTKGEKWIEKKYYSLLPNISFHSVGVIPVRINSLSGAERFGKIV